MSIAKDVSHHNRKSIGPVSGWNVSSFYHCKRDSNNHIMSVDLFTMWKIIANNYLWFRPEIGHLKKAAVFLKFIEHHKI